MANVEHDAAVGRAPAAGTVATAAHGQVHTRFPGHFDDAPDVVDIGDLDDQRRMLVHLAAEDAAGIVVIGI
jgi:hypothetical protein